MFKICGDTVRLYNKKDSLSIMEEIRFVGAFGESKSIQRGNAETPETHKRQIKNIFNFILKFLHFLIDHKLEIQANIHHLLN